MKEELRQYGFSEKEVEIYLSCIKLGEETTNRISEMSNISRTTVYDILENLKKKGVSYSFIKEKKTVYGVVGPSKLIELINQKADLIESIKPKIEEIKSLILPKPKVEVYEGKTGLMIASQDMLKEKEILTLGKNGEYDYVFELFQANFAQRRVEKNILLKAIIEEEIPNHMIEGNIREITQIKINKNFSKMNTTQFIYGNNVLSLIYGEEPVAIITRSKEFANSQRILFENLWRSK